MSDTTSEEYKRGFIIGMAMNPLMVTTETAPEPTEQNESGVIVADGVTGVFGTYVVNDVIICVDATEGGV